MKKYSRLLIFTVLTFGISFAQQTGMKQIDATIDPAKLEEANADLSQIEIDFCDKPGEKSITYDAVPGVTQDICYEAKNTSEKDITITVGFVDGALTNDQRGNKACMQQGEDKRFGQYVTGYLASFVIPANNLSFQHATLRIPQDATGTINGCLVYYTKGVEMGGQVNFTVLMRKAKFIDVTVQSKIKSLKSKIRGLSLGVLVLIVFFTRFRGKPKKLLKK